MSKNIFDKTTGKVKLSREPSTKLKPGREAGDKLEDKRVVDFCLNCTKPTCKYGNCIELSIYKQILLGRKKCKYCGSYLIDHDPKILSVFCPTCNIIKPLEEIMEVV